ncbi:MAG: CoA-binding domain protein [Frankiales bacterium]|nr:CoA-binding domain protein [Frankiales bacterium]
MTAPSFPGQLGYPSTWEADAVLTDGGTVHLRPIRPDDAERLAAFHARLSKETVYNRFFAYRPVLSDADLSRFTRVDHDDRVALVATLNDAIVGVVRYDRSPGSHDAEVAFVVEDAHQGRGLGPMLLEHLAAAARERGIHRFTADVLPTNRAMLGVFRTAGYAVARDLADGYVELSFPITQTGTSLAVMRDREHRAEARSVQRLLSPRSVAVVGASREPGAPGHELLRSLLSNGFEGPVFPVNPAAAHVSGVKAYADVRDVPDQVDLAVIAVPAPEVAAAVRACAAKGVRGLVVVSGGFADAGPDGRARLDEVVGLARAGGMRLIGPNAMGVVNTDPAVRLHATFAAGSPPAGTVGVFSQSGALAGTFLAETERRGLGLSSFVSIGDRADVSGNDLLQFWRADERTEVVLLHLQGFGNPRKFARIAREVSRTKPVVALKSGHGQGDVAVDALFASAGVVRVGSLAQLFSTAQLFAYQPLPAGPRVGIVGNSSALAAMAADACRAAGLEVPELAEQSRVRLRALTGTTETANPVDLGPFAGPSELAAALDVLMTSGQVDAVLAVVVPPPHAGALTPEGGSLGAQLGAVLTTVGDGRLPLLASFLGTDGVPPALAVPGPSGGPGRGSVPSWASPESAVLALSRAVAYAAWRARPEGTVPDLADVDPAGAAAALDGLPLDGSWLSHADAARVLAHVGIRVWPTRLVSDADGAVAAAGELGWPVALKASDERWRHRLDVGAVVLGVDGPDELRRAWDDVAGVAGGGPAYVQPMAAPGVSTVVRLVQDPSAGPLVSLRLGGVALDLLVDPVTRTLPLTDRDASELVRAIRGSELITGSPRTGGTASDVAALEDLLLRVAALAELLPQVAEVVLDPVLVQRSGAVPLHAGVRLLPPGSDPERGPRRLGSSYAIL